jgi:hypothetical protein
MTLRTLAPLQGTLAAVFLIAAASGPVRAQSVQYQVDVSVDDAVQTAAVDAPGQPAISLSAETPGVGTATGRAYATIGVNEASSTLRGPNPTSPISLGYAVGTSRWADIITISHPRLNGTRGTFTTRMRVVMSGNFSITADGIIFFPVEFLGQWLALIQVFDSQGVSQEAFRAGFWRPTADGTAIEYLGDPLGESLTEVSFSFVYGEPFTLVSLLQTNLRANKLVGVGGTIDSSLDGNFQALWQGITSLRDADGNPVRKAKLKSASGVKWLKLDD